MSFVSVLSDFWRRRRNTIRNISIALGAIFAVVLLIEMFFYSSAAFFPKACTVCHYEDFSFNSWKQSIHNEVSCSQCHHYRFGMYTSFIGKYWTGFYSGHPIVDVKDESCFTCHGEEIMADTIIFKNNVKFNHSDHYNKLNRTVELRCSSCHTALRGGAHMEVSEETCFLCHFKDVKRGQSYTGCPSCHGTPKDVIQHGGFVFSHESYLKVGVTCDQCHIDVARGTGDVPSRICRNCHVERLSKYDDPFAVHEIHIGKLDLKCIQCHSEIEHGEIQLVNTLDVRCESCHGTSHSSEKEMYMGTGGRGVPDVPSRMFAAQVSCEGCHPQMSSAQTMNPKEELKAKREACVRCHGKGYDKMLDDWLKVMHKLTRELKPDIERARRVLASMNQRSSQYGQVKQLIEDAIYNYNFVVNGKGVHNIDYAVRLLKKSVSNLSEAMTLVRRSRPRIADPILTTPDAYCMAFCHHIEKPPKYVEFERIDFPHQRHVDDVGLECTVCHSPDKHKMRIITKSQCMNCHHEQQDLACSTCHLHQQELYTGNIPQFHISDQPDIMAAAEVDCEGCHDVSQSGEVLQLVAESCVSCHEEGYDEMLREWYNTLQEEMSTVIVLINQIKEKMSAGEIPSSKIPAYRKKIEHAEQMLNFLEKAKPVHNQALSEELMSQIKEELSDLI